MNSSGCLSKSTMNLNKHLQINTKAQKLLRFDLLMTCYDLIMDFGFGSMDGHGARPIQTATTNGLLRRHPHKKGILFPSPCRRLKWLKRPTNWRALCHTDPVWWEWKAVGDGDGGDSHPVGEVDSDPVPGLDELLSKIAKDEQVWYQTVSKSQQGNHMIDEEQTKLQMKLQYLL